jgi:hypothetical protein
MIVFAFGSWNTRQTLFFTFQRLYFYKLPLPMARATKRYPGPILEVL